MSDWFFLGLGIAFGYIVSWIYSGMDKAMLNSISTRLKNQYYEVDMFQITKKRHKDFIKGLKAILDEDNKVKKKVKQ